MMNRVQIAVLGPLEVRTSDGVIDIAGARLRALLIRLAIAAPAPVTVSALADALWGDDPPAEPANALQSLVSRLRRALHDPDVVRQVPGGYRIDDRGRRPRPAPVHPAGAHRSRCS